MDGWEVNEGGMNGGCLMAGREFGKKRKEKSFSFSVFPGWRPDLLSAPVKLLGPGSCFLSSLFGPVQTRPETGWAPGRCCLLAGMLFSLAPDQPHFSSSSTCKVSPSPYRYCTNFDLAVWVASEDVYRFPTRLQVSWLGKRQAAVLSDRAAILFLPSSITTLMSRDPQCSGASDWQLTNGCGLMGLK